MQSIDWFTERFGNYDFDFPFEFVVVTCDGASAWLAASARRYTQLNVNCSLTVTNKRQNCHRIWLLHIHSKDWLVPTNSYHTIYESYSTQAYV